MATEFRWKVITIVDKASPFYREMGEEKVLQYRDTGFFGSDWNDVYTENQYIYIDIKKDKTDA